jgi:phosphatidylglycerophosphatase A
LTSAHLWKKTALALGTGLGLGMAPFAPGTFGSLLGPPLAWALEMAGLPIWGKGLAAVVIFLIGVPICTRAAEHFGKKDPGQVVYDEIAAFPFLFIIIDVTLLSAVAGFVWFRIFDIAKPWPIKRFEQLPAGWGIMVDDLIAAVYAFVFLWLTVWLSGRL